MATGRRALFLAIAGLVISGAAARAQESRAESQPASRPASTPQQLKTIDEIVEAAAAEENAGNLEEALKLSDRAVETLRKELDRYRTPVSQPASDLYNDLLQRCDRLVDRVETTEFEAKVPERDMLSAKERRFWGASPGAKWTPSGREISIEGVAVEGRKVQGVASFYPRKSEPWHDIVLDLEFTIVAGEFDLFLRYWPDKRYYSIKFNAAAGYEPNKPYRMTLRVKGSSISLKQPEQPENRDRLDPMTSRTGGIGFGLSPGSKVEISKLRLKVLR